MSSRGAVRIKIGAAEAGQKVLAFLQRNLKNSKTGVPLPGALLHKLVRSGQVRVNSSRVKAFQILKEGDELRIPPLGGVSAPWDFDGQVEAEASLTPAALPGPLLGPAPEFEPEFGPEFELGSGAASSVCLQVEKERQGSGQGLAQCLQHACPKLTVLAETEDYLAVCKPAGLPVHGGTKQEVSLIGMVHACAGAALRFKPTLAHRLDKGTSGVLLIAKNYAFLRRVQDALQHGQTRKDYLVWVSGNWPIAEISRLEDFLEKRQGADYSRMEKVEVVQQNASDAEGPNSGAFCSCLAKPLLKTDAATLLHVQLLTGRTHQIRVQLASRGHPVVGDLKYGGPKCEQGMLLHAWRFALPGTADKEQDSATELVFEALPPWTGPFAVPAGQVL